MKKNILLTIIVMLYFPINAIASPELSFDPIIIQQGEESNLNINISGANQNYAGINITIVMPSEIEITDISSGNLLLDFSLDYRIFSNNNKATILGYSEDKSFSTSGTLFVLKVKAKKNASPGSKSISFLSASNNSFINSNALSNSDGSVSIVPILKNSNITVSTENDTDWDGLLDKWEFFIINSNANDHIETLEDVNPEDDFDGDGASNLKEFKSGTDPTNPADYPSEKDDHGNDCNTATVVTINSSVKGVINKKGDYDFFKFMSDLPSALDIYTTGDFDSDGYLYNSNCNIMDHDDNSGTSNNFNIIRSVSGGTFYISVKHSDESKTGKYTLHVTTIPDDHGNSCVTATVMNVNSSISGTIEGGRDSDYFSIQVPYDGKLSIYTKGTTDTKGLFKKNNCLTIANNDDFQNGLNFKIERQVTKGTYYVAVSHYSSKGTGNYTLHIDLLENSYNDLVSGQGKPSIEITDYPPYNNRIRNITGKVYHENPIEYKIVVYIYIDGYWIKPNNLYPLTDINQEGYWQCDVTTAVHDRFATKIAVFLIPVGYNPPIAEGLKSLPDHLYDEALDIVEIQRK